MPRYSLRTLLIVLAIGPPILAAIWRMVQPEPEIVWSSAITVSDGVPFRSTALISDLESP